MIGDHRRLKRLRFRSQNILGKEEVTGSILVEGSRV